MKPMLAPAAMPLPSVTAEFSPAPASLHGLDGVNFFLAGVLAGFGPYVAVYLAAQNWTQEKIGFVLIYQGESRSSLIVSALIVLPQIVVAVMAPWIGRQANQWGRRPLLLNSDQRQLSVQREGGHSPGWGHENSSGGLSVVEA